MCSNSSPSSVTSSVIGGSWIRYFAFLTRWTSDTPLNLGFTYAGVKVIGTYLWDSIVGRSPLCHGDYLVDVLPENRIVFGRVLTTTTIPPRLNL